MTRQAGGRQAGGPPAARTAIVITASDRSAAGEREDSSGRAVAERLEGLGFAVERMVVPDDRARIETTLVAAATRHRLVLTTGGTGLTPRDVTPQATLAVIASISTPVCPVVAASARMRRTPAARSGVIATRRSVSASG